MNNPPNKPQPPPPALQVTTQQFSGPLPPPEVLAKYNAIIPNAAERILAMAEADISHLHTMETTAMQGAHRERFRGQLFAFGTTLLAFAVSAFALYHGHETAASVIGGTTVVGLVSVFVLGRTSRQN